MTARESYVYGWVYGRLEQAIADSGNTYDVSGEKFGQACMRPHHEFARIHSAAIQCHALTGEVQAAIGAALDEVYIIDGEISSGPEPVQSLDLQGCWQLGYYKSQSGAPLPPPKPDTFDIGLRRKIKNLTQSQLAEQIGVDQSIISRWEQGNANPSPENLAKLHEILD